MRRIFALSMIASAFSSSARLIYINMTDTFEMGEDRNTRFVLDALDQAFASARDNDVDLAAEPSRAYARRPRGLSLPIELDRRGGQTS